MRVLVIGGSGFIGSAVLRALMARGVQTRAGAAPRLRPISAAGAGQLALSVQAGPELKELLEWADVMVNAAGLSDAGQCDESALNAANAAMPVALARLGRDSGLRRFVHFSSAAVQGDRPLLDATDELQPFSPYSRSKALGEQLLTELRWAGVVLYRPQGVHGPGRRTTASLARIARSPLASVAGRGEQPTPQALVDNVGDAAAFLALSENHPPPIVVHPWEGLTAAGLLEHLGGRNPWHLPPRGARQIVTALTVLGRGHPKVAAHTRRLQMMWFGQPVAASWLTDQGWRPTAEWSTGVHVE